MNSTAKIRKGKQWLIRNWFLVVLGMVWLLILVLLGVRSLRQFKGTTPIPRIEMEDTLLVEKTVSRLESYREEMEEINRQQARRQLAMEKIIAMDFGTIMEMEQEGKMSNDPVRERKDAENGQKGKRKVQPTLLPHTPVPRPKPKRINKEPSEWQTRKAEPNPFFTVRADAVHHDSVSSLKEKSLFKAVVNGDQKLLHNATVSLRLLEELKVGEHVFPRNTLVYGRLSGGGNGRIKIRISRIRSVPVQLQVYDQDYQEGIAYVQEEPVPSSLAESRDQAIEELLYSVPYGGVLNGVAEAGRNMLRKSRKSKPLYLADGYALFIGREDSSP